MADQEFCHYRRLAVRAQRRLSGRLGSHEAKLHGGSEEEHPGLDRGSGDFAGQESGAEAEEAGVVSIPQGPDITDNAS